MIVVGAKALMTLLGALAVHGTLLALFAIVLVRGARLRPAWRAAVWLIVLAKFALPWGPALPWSLADVLAMVRGGGGGTIVVGAPGEHVAAGAGPSAAWLVLAALWAAGAVAVLVRALLAHARARRAVRSALPALPHVVAQLAELAARVGVRAPRLVVGEHACVVGIVRPTIVVPRALFGGEPALLRAALLHELAHVRRRDALGRLVQLAANALYWWFPVVRLVSRRLELAREAACDAWALEAGDVSRPAYARLLVQLSHQPAPALALAAPHALDDRVRAVLGPPVRARLPLAHRAALLIWALIALGGARTAAARGEHVTCVYTPELASALLLAHPEADSDGDGVLTHAEACDFQAELRHREPSSPLDQAESELLAEPLCCNPDPAEGLSTPAACQLEGVDR